MTDTMTSTQIKINELHFNEKSSFCDISQFFNLMSVKFKVNITEFSSRDCGFRYI